MSHLDGKFRIRLGMMNPENTLPIIDKLVECYKNEKMYKFLHIPLQSGSNKILKLMNRKYKAEDFLKIIKEFRKDIPNIAIATDIIAGFPEETEEDFFETIKIIQEIQPDTLNVSKFCKRKGTEAEKMPQINEKISKQRAIKLMDLYKEIADEKNRKMLGKQAECLVYDKFGGYYLARTENYKLVLIKTSRNILGRIVKVKIAGVERNHLIGEIEEKSED